MSFSGFVLRRIYSYSLLYIHYCIHHWIISFYVDSLINYFERILRKFKGGTGVYWLYCTSADLTFSIQGRGDKEWAVLCGMVCARKTEGWPDRQYLRDSQTDEEPKTGDHYWSGRDSVWNAAMLSGLLARKMWVRTRAVLNQEYFTYATIVGL